MSTDPTTRDEARLDAGGALLWLIQAAFEREDWERLARYAGQIREDEGRPEAAWARLWLALREGRGDDAWALAPRVWPELQAVRDGAALVTWSEGGREPRARVADVTRRWPKTRADPRWAALAEIADGRALRQELTDAWLRGLVKEMGKGGRP